MPKTNYAITFARMRTDVQRLITVAHTDETKRWLKGLLNVFDQLERKLDEQVVPTKPRKLTKGEEHSISVGAANYMRGHPRSESEHDAYMLRGWDAAQAKTPVQPHTHTEEVTHELDG